MNYLFRINTPTTFPGSPGEHGALPAPTPARSLAVWVRRASALTAACAAWALAVAPTPVAAASEQTPEARWQWAPALAPPPPEGVAPAPYPIPVGTVGEISFWAPNRGLLIEAGGLYAYDGSTWHELASVCGGGEGRIAWAGPDEFWTIANQRPGQALQSGGGAERLLSISLCHFADGQVVASYAMPLEEPNSYSRMNAAACYGPNECWFAGGTFHLFWNGSTVTVVPEPEDHAAVDMAVFDGHLYESVQVSEGDRFLSCENSKTPALLHEIGRAEELFSCDGIESPFRDVAMATDAGVLLPRYDDGTVGAAPGALQGLDLATNGGPLGEGATQLWAAAVRPPVSTDPGPITVLHASLAKGAVEWTQVAPNAEGETPLSGMGGSATEILEHRELGVEDAIAPEPGSASAWVSTGSGGAGAGVVRINDKGESERYVVLPEAREQVGNRGEAGPIVCPAAEDCWLATAGSGWLFHYTNGIPVTPDHDPFFDGEDGIISYRPPDDGVPEIPPIIPPEDDSLINQQTEAAAKSAQQTPTTTASTTKLAPAKPLLKKVKDKLLHGHILVISFTLTANAHVRLVGRRDGKVVASTPRESLKPGHHALTLTLNPSMWPKSIKFEATPLTEPTSSSPTPQAEPHRGGEGPLAANTVETP